MTNADNTKPQDLIALLRTFIGDTQIVRAAREAADVIDQQAARIAELEATQRTRIAAIQPVRAGEDLTITSVPERIYLNLGDIMEMGEIPFQQLTDVTWCEDRIDDTDIEYTRVAAPVADSAMAKEPLHKFALIRDRNYEGEGLSLWTWNGENYSGADGDCLSPDADGTLDGYTVEWLTDHQLEQRIGSMEKDAETWRNLLSLLIGEIPQRHWRADDPNAPGHAHLKPGIWDNDNGALSGKECAWCAAWNEARAAIAAKENTNV